ncbi:MAG: DNA polymerase, partial [Acidaminococcaceae bacterium]|nr:DNA polymerase [Acidaminococcaceae bacterium]
QQCKTIAFATLYGMEAGTLSKNLSVSQQEAVELQGKFFGAYVRGRQWIGEVQQQVMHDMEYRTVFGRLLRFAQSSSLQRQAVNYPIQNLASDITMYGLVRIHKRLRKGDFGNTRLLLTVHDSILVETKEEPLQVMSAIKEEMERNILDDYIPFRADIKCYGTKWGDLKEIK